MYFCDDDTIVAPATPVGGALCVVRLSGERAIEVCDEVFRGRKALRDVTTSTLHYGVIVDGEEVVDDVVVGVFRSPHSYTGEDVVEISAHGSRYVVGRIISLFTSCGVRMAQAGEFTRRAFLAGKMDLSQAEAVADVIAADSRASHAIASTQMRGAYSAELGVLREELLKITSLLELELDFSEEDVEFADRQQLGALLEQLQSKVSALASSFALGNVLKYGVNVAIVGRPNVGKSTLLNRLIGEDRAMVSDIAGTTRDSIEESINIEGVIYRFVDTAGLHATDDRLEQMGIERTHKALEKAHIILWVTDADGGNVADELCGFEVKEEQTILHIVNKIDLLEGMREGLQNATSEAVEPTGKPIGISAKRGEGVDELLAALRSVVDATEAYRGDVIVSSQRHYEALCKAQEALQMSLDGLRNGVPTDLLSEDIRQVMYHLGTITGEISTEDILKSIFSQFCVGK